jgi:hypothetical protein
VAKSPSPAGSSARGGLAEEGAATFEALYHLGTFRGFEEDEKAVKCEIAAEIVRLLCQKRADGMTRAAFLAAMIVREAEKGDAVFVRLAMEAENDYDPRVEIANWGEDEESED